MYRHFLKPIFDFIFALILLPFVLLIMIVLYPVVKLNSKGPFIYKSGRVGKDEKMYKMYKIRTMKKDAIDIRNEDGSTFNADGDDRVTSVGKFLRKTSLDELPQIFNVLLGNMSFIGPRPIMWDFNLDQLDDTLKSRFLIRPGITGYSQAYYRNSVSQKQQFYNDMLYYKKISFIFDIKIFLKTIKTIIFKKGINRNR